MMNMRISSAPANTASGTVSHHDTATLRCIRYQSSAYGTKVLSNCHTARQVDGCWYFSITSFHGALGGRRAMDSMAMTVLAIACVEGNGRSERAMRRSTAGGERPVRPGGSVTLPAAPQCQFGKVNSRRSDLALH